MTIWDPLDRLPYQHQLRCQLLSSSWHLCSFLSSIVFVSLGLALAPRVLSVIELHFKGEGTALLLKAIGTAVGRMQMLVRHVFWHIE
eukprot:735125-Amphidinium_carterae.1